MIPRFTNELKVSGWGGEGAGDEEVNEGKSLWCDK